MAAQITFDINPSDTILFSAFYPDPADTQASLVITTPDSIVLTLDPATTIPLVGFPTSNPFSELDPGAVIEMTVKDFNAAPSGVITKDAVALTELPWAKFPPGVYTITYTSGSDTRTAQSLQFTTIDDCLYGQIDKFMYDTCCNKCGGGEQKRLVEKLLAVKEGAKLDFRINALADLADKLSALQHLCDGEFCECSCNC